MGEGPSPRVVITGASRGLGLATATHLHRRGWTVVAAMRTPDVGLSRVQENLGRAHDPSRLIGVRLDLEDPDSIESAIAQILDTVGVPDGLVHNAGIAGAGAVEEMPVQVVEQMFATNLFGPIRLTRGLLPGMRDAGRGRIVVVSSHAATSGMGAVSAYAASKSALERWAESLSMEVAPFGLGVSVLVTGTFKTDILERTQSWKDEAGPYAALHSALESTGDQMVRWARRPDRFAPAVERALHDRRPFGRHAVGPDAVAMVYGNRLLPTSWMQFLTTRLLGLPRPRPPSSPARSCGRQPPDPDRPDKPCTTR